MILWYTARYDYNILYIYIYSIYIDKCYIPFCCSLYTVYGSSQGSLPLSWPWWTYYVPAHPEEDPQLENQWQTAVLERASVTAGAVSAPPTAPSSATPAAPPNPDHSGDPAALESEEEMPGWRMKDLETEFEWRNSQFRYRVTKNFCSTIFSKRDFYKFSRPKFREVWSKPFKKFINLFSKKYN